MMPPKSTFGNVFFFFIFHFSETYLSNVCTFLFFSFSLQKKQIVKGKELLEDLQRDSGVASTPASPLSVPAESRDEQPAVDQVSSSSASSDARERSNSSSILDLASSLQTQLSKFGHRLDDTRERLEDTSRCYELLDKVKTRKNSPTEVNKTPLAGHLFSIERYKIPRVFDRELFIHRSLVNVSDSSEKKQQKNKKEKYHGVVLG